MNNKKRKNWDFWIGSGEFSVLVREYSYLIVNVLKNNYELFRSSRPELFSKIGVPRNFTKFTGKQLRQSPFFNKVADRGLQLYEKRDSGTGLTHLVLQNTSGQLLLTVLERNECGPYNTNQRYVLTYVLLPIIQRECDTFCCGHTDSFKHDLCCYLLATSQIHRSNGGVLYKKLFFKIFAVIHCITIKHLC